MNDGEDQKAVTDLVLAYRECARTVWNGYFRHLPDGWHEFINVEHEMFVGLVLVQAFDGYGFGSPRADLVQLRPAFGPCGIKVLWARASQDGKFWDWKPRQLQPGAIALSFIEFFDWDNDGVRDFQFARGRVQECEDDESLVGADLLIPALSAEFYTKVIA